MTVSLLLSFPDVLLKMFLLLSVKRLLISMCPPSSLSDFSLPVSFVNAEIGQCPNLAPPPPPLLPGEEEPEEEKEVTAPLGPPLTSDPATPPPAVSGWKPSH